MNRIVGRHAQGSLYQAVQVVEEGGAAASEEIDQRARSMAEFSITYNGRHYEYAGYRYNRLEDAVQYAKLCRAKPAGEDATDPMAAPEIVEVPDESQRHMLAALGIIYREGIYRLGPYRYERMADAVDYARKHGPV